MQRTLGLLAGILLSLTATAQLTFNVSIAPNRGHPNLACENQDTVFLSASVPSNYDTIIWSTFPFVFSAGGVTDTFFIPPFSSTIHISLIAIDTNVSPHDTAVVVKSIHVTGTPMPYLAVFPQTTVCVSTELKFKGDFSYAVDSFKWVIDNNIINDGNPEQFYTYSSAGQDTVLLIAYNVCGTDTAQVIVDVTNNVTPSGIFTNVAPSQACPSTPVKFALNPPDLITGYDVRWDFGDGSPTVSGHISDVREVTHFYASAGTYNATAIVKWENGACPNDSAILPMTVNVTSNYSPSFASIFVSPADSACPNTQFNFYLNVSNPENVAYVEWDMGDGSYYYTANTFFVSHTYASTGTYTVTAIVHSHCGDTIHVNKTIKVKSDAPTGYSPNIFTSADLVCPNEQFIVYVNSQYPSDTILIDFNGNVDTFFNMPIIDSLTAPSTVGFDTVFVYFKNQCGNWDTAFSVVEVNTFPPYAFVNVYANSNTYCAGDSVRISVYITPSIQVDTIYVDYGDGTVDTIVSPLLTYFNLSHVYTSEGSYLISATMVKSCMNIRLSGYDFVTINTPKPMMVFNVYTSPACAGETIYFSAYGTFAPDEQSAYVWDFGDGHTATGSSPSHIYTEAGTYDVYLYTYGCGYIDTVKSRVRIIGAPAYSINASQTSVCVGNSITFNAVQEGSISANTLVWSFGDGTVDTGSSVSHTFTTPGTYRVILMAVGDTCSSQSEQYIQVTPNTPPVANFIYNYLGNGTTQFYNMSSNATAYLWDFGDGDTSTAPNPIHTYTANGTYTVTLVAFNPCGFTDTIEQTITITDLSTVNVEIANSGETFFIYPNPVQEFIRVELPEGFTETVDFRIMDFTGKTLISVTLSRHSNTVETVSLPAGTYIAHIIDRTTGTILWKGKLVKNQ